jgi:hypothetical protein
MAIGIFNGNSRNRQKRSDDLGDDYTPEEVNNACEVIRRAGESPLNIGRGKPTLIWREMVIARAAELTDGDKRLVQAASQGEL